jgi:hypothetical protein
MTAKLFDIHIEGVPLNQLNGIRGLTFGPYPRSLGVRGVQKMVDRFVKCMLTSVGSDLSDPDYGTALAGAFLGNVDSGTLRSLALQSVVAAESKIKEYDAEYALNDEERLASARVDDIATNESDSGVTLTITLKNVAGVSVQVLIPQIAE